MEDGLVQGDEWTIEQSGTLRFSDRISPQAAWNF